MTYSIFQKSGQVNWNLEEVPFDLQLLAQDVAELLAIKCREKNLEMLLRYKPGTPHFVLGDPGRIRQVMLNLLSNSIKFTDQGYVLLSVELENIIKDFAEIRVSVKDTGIGIPDDKQALIFNQFDQANGSTTRKFGGTGLGLSISKQLSQLMGGDVEVQSQIGEGAIFSFTMKLGVSRQEIKKTRLVLGDYSALEGLKALIVDDVDTARHIISEQIAELKLNIEMASSGAEALTKLTRASQQDKPYRLSYA